MPQMAPLSWTILMMIFISLYLINTIKLYFTNTYNLSTDIKVKKMSQTKYNWKW